MLWVAHFTKGEIQVEDLYDVRKREYLVLIPLAAAALFFGIIPQPVIGIIEPFAREFSTFLLKVAPVHSMP